LAAFKLLEDKGMTNRQMYAETDPRHLTIKVKQMLTEAVTHLREDVSKVNEPKAQALFETTAEVLQGLVKAYDHYEQHSEQAFQ